MGNELVTTNGDAPSGGTAFGREDVARGSVFDGAQTAILPEEAIDKELKAIADLRRTDRKAYNKDNTLHARELALLEMKATWDESNAQDRRWKTRAAQIMRAVPDAATFEQSYDRLWSNLSEISRDAIRYELALPATEYPARPASEADVALFATSDVGAELMKEWGGQARKKLALVQARAERLIRTGEEAVEWFESLPAPQAKAVIKVLAG
jgi:hypothetical protein